MTGISYEAYKVLQRSNAKLNLGGLAVLLPDPMTETLNTEGVHHAFFTGDPVWAGLETPKSPGQPPSPGKSAG